MDDAQEVIVERLPDGRHLIAYGRRAGFALNAERDCVLCAPTDLEEPAWKRFLLDTVLVTTSLLTDFEALHASSVTGESGLLVFLAGTGGGKTSLALELMARGGTLFCDDVLALGRDGPNVVAQPGPSLMNVPRSGTPPPGRVLAELGDELWIEVEGPAVEPQTPAAIFLLERRAGLAEEIHRLEPSCLPLLPHALGIDPTNARARARFEALGDLASSVPLLRLQAPPDAPPRALADLVERGLESSRAPLARVEA